MIKFFQNQLTQLVRKVGITLAALTLSMVVMQPVNAQISQAPLLSPAGAVDPNLVLMFDDSLSMSAQFIYQYGGLINGFGRTGPGGSATVSTMCPINFPGITCTGNYTGTAPGYGNYPGAPTITDRKSTRLNSSHQ